MQLGYESRNSGGVVFFASEMSTQFINDLFHGTPTVNQVPNCRAVLFETNPYIGRHAFRKE